MHNKTLTFHQFQAYLKVLLGYFLSSYPILFH